MQLTGEEIRDAMQRGAEAYSLLKASYTFVRMVRVAHAKKACGDMGIPYEDCHSVPLEDLYRSRLFLI